MSTQPPDGTSGPVRPELRSRPNSPVPPQVVYVAQPSVFRRWVSWIGWTGFLVCLLILFGLVSQFNDYFNTTSGIREKYHSGSKTSSDKIAIIDVSGVIGNGDGYVKKQIDRIREDEQVRAIVVRIDSPGGTITGSDYIYHHLTKLREEFELPLVVSMGSMATSGGYYVAMAVGDSENTIYAEPTTTTGSIGVIIPHYDISGLLDRMEIKDDSLVSHPRKKLLSMTRPMRQEDREVLERYLGEAFTRFKQIILEGRPYFRENEAKLDELATGEIFTATYAQENHLVDRIGFIEEAIERAAELAGLTPDETRVIRYEAPLTLFGTLASARATGNALRQASSGWNLETLLELTVPRAYYLHTVLPPLRG